MKTLGELTLQAHSGSIPEFLEFISGWAKEAGYGGQRIREMEFAVAEALTNIVEFVCTEGEEVTIRVGDDKGRRFVIHISDYGKSYNMLLEADPFLSGSDPSEKRPSVSRIKRIGDVEYKRFEGKNYLVVTVYPASMGGSTSSA
ncbi:MAG: ATP-binding protein [Syntrophobacterales bacterium]|jgi:hypothetical protein|nr:ATP-binding protein [Syntrophobacterales bacterium]